MLSYFLLYLKNTWCEKDVCTAVAQCGETVQEQYGG